MCAAAALLATARLVGVLLYIEILHCTWHQSNLPLLSGLAIICDHPAQHAARPQPEALRQSCQHTIGACVYILAGSTSMCEEAMSNCILSG